MKELKWEEIIDHYVWQDQTTTTKRKQTFRARIPGGWLVKSFSRVPSSDFSDSRFADANGGITFVPDPNHEWK